MYLQTRLILTVLCFFSAVSEGVAVMPEEDPALSDHSQLAWPAAIPRLSDVYNRYRAFDLMVREGLVDPTDGQERLALLLKEIDVDFDRRNCESGSMDMRWAFPIANYTPENIGGENGSGYRGSNFSYFDGINIRGHFAHDIFVYDRNRDLLDDRTKNPVAVLSVRPGVIVSSVNNWEPGSHFKAGNYVRVYHPRSQTMSYYAHLAKVTIGLGHCVGKGEKIGYVGRSGLNADSSKSPTHLHFGYLSVKNGNPQPIDTYQELLDAETISQPPDA